MKKRNLNVLIIDDDPNAIDILKCLLEDFDEITEINAANSVDQGIAQIISGLPQLVFLDIDMPGKDGFEFIHELNLLGLSTTIIFQTAHPKYSIKAIRHAAFDYLIKPIDPIELKKAIQRFHCEGPKGLPRPADGQPKQKVKFNMRSGNVFFGPNEILYVQAEGNYSELFLCNGGTQMVTLLLIDVISLLPEKQFLRISRSAAINTKYLKSLDHKSRLVHLAVNGNDTSLKAAHKYVKAVENCY